MDKNIEIILNFRKYVLAQIESLDAEQLNFIPANFTNNIIWNVGHINAVLQALCYRYSGLPIKTDEKYFHPFLPGTKPDGFLDSNEIQLIKRQAIETVHQLKTDLENGSFKQYTKVEKIETVYGITVASIQDTLKYVTHHEGIHYNAITTLKRLVEKPSY
ncbi:DinB family protein [Sabulibacter ruber]|uniref:DinB family protein n=1 Tax=Sabulibacter ruber TaxID=2811901 RepID=UPI001A96273B|nr:DinB family protein [Sabulibacter ruber]